MQFISSLQSKKWRLIRTNESLGLPEKSQQKAVFSITPEKQKDTRIRRAAVPFFHGSSTVMVNQNL